jgi:hypothetical protein
MRDSFFKDTPPITDLKDTPPIAEPVSEPSGFPNEVVEQGTDGMERLLGWWYKFTTPPRPPANASFIRREADRKARLLSTVTFFYLALQALFLVASVLSAPSTILVNLVGDAIGIAILLLNRAGKGTWGGVVLVSWIELSLALVIASARPLDVADTQLYDMFVLGELLAVSLLPVFSVFIVALLNSVLIAVDLLYQPKTQALAAVLQKEMTAILIRPIGVQMIVAGVAALWVYSAGKALERANRAEMVATLEHALSEQRAVAEQEKVELEASIQQLIQVHVDATKGQIVSRIPYPPSKVLWPLVGVINSLWVRLRQSQQTEQELQQFKRMIASYTEIIQRSSRLGQPLPLPRTGTELDPLILSIKSLQESYAGSPNLEDKN